MIIIQVGCLFYTLYFGGVPVSTG